jgi:hypothetical protein
MSGQALGAIPVGTSAGKLENPVEPLVFERPAHNNGLELFAAHSSHASHSSHYSGSGAAAPAPQAGPSAAMPAPGIVPLAPRAALQDKEVIVLRVQAQLHALGYYASTIDGQFNDTTKAALRRYQLVKGLPATSALDDATLVSLGIVY